MKITQLKLADVMLLEPTVFRDNRGYVIGSYHQDVFKEVTRQVPLFVQDVHSYSHHGVLRGLHYQLPPKAQDKWVQVIQGAIFDVVVDIRKSSATFGQWVGETLTGDNHKQLWIPQGFAHGFWVISDTAHVLYKCTRPHAPEHEHAIRWDDPSIAIEWPVDQSPCLSSRDAQAVAWAQALVFP